MTHYIHNINPVVLEIGGPLAIRWYGLSYLLGFLASILILRHWSKRGEFEVPEREVSNFVVMLAFFGVFLGGRLGYVLFYNFSSFLEDPLSLVRVWDGGMSSHGGFIGVMLFILWYAKKNKYSFLNLTDHFAATASLGLGFGRLANFVNGELWGRVSDVKWAVVFPQELTGLPREQWIALGQPGHYNIPLIEKYVEAGQLLPRHPSQLYQAFAEGFLVFALMLIIRKTARGKRPGALSASYLVLYALARIAMEFFREPDNGEFFIAWITKGQFYSIFLIAAALFGAWKAGLLSAKSAQ